MLNKTYQKKFEITKYHNILTVILFIKSTSYLTKQVKNIEINNFTVLRKFYTFLDHNFLRL